MPYDPGMLSQGSADAGSPLTAVLQYLSGRGIPPNAGNIKAALEANARDPGVIPGLRNAAAEDSAPAPSGRTSAAPSGSRGATPQNTINESLGPGEIQPGMGTGTVPAAAGPDISLGGAGGLAALVPAISAAILGGRRPALPTPGAAPVPGAAAGPMPDVGAGVLPEGRVAQGFANNPVDKALTEATEGAPVVEGVKPVNPDLLGNRRPGPSTPVAGAEVPQMPPTSATRVNPDEVMNPPGSRPDPAMTRPRTTPRVRPRLMVR